MPEVCFFHVKKYGTFFQVVRRYRDHPDQQHQLRSLRVHRGRLLEGTQGQGLSNVGGRKVQMYNEVNIGALY
jgi:hypothetical protein